MSDVIIARRYAQALAGTAEDKATLAETDQDMDLIRSTLEASRPLVLLFESPIVSREKKEKVIDELFATRVQPTTLDFLRMLVEKRREGLFPAIVRAYRALRDQQLGIVEAHVTTALPLDAAEEQRLQQSLARMTGRNVRLRVREDASLIGGMVVRVGDTVYDGSVRQQLASLREQFARGAAVPGLS